MVVAAGEMERKQPRELGRDISLRLAAWEKGSAAGRGWLLSNKTQRILCWTLLLARQAHFSESSISTMGLTIVTLLLLALLCKLGHRH